ncbi:(2Fe-2S)-binding protein [Bacillus sp. JJ1521]|uniref:(2Fe-2S)-binding protein n=1 Tax=Bacillus sp. JJ1521 TaxID=3122957 RepID=UPI002FFF791D
MNKHNITSTVNGEQVNIDVNASDLLIDVLRDRGLISIKLACDMQVCGACTVLLDGKPYSACTTLAIEMDGKDILTTEGLADGENLHIIQQAFMDKGALQCGFCTSGIMLSSLALLKENANPSEDEIKHYLHGNICRCTGYSTIVEAVQQAASKQQREGVKIYD